MTPYRFISFVRSPRARVLCLAAMFALAGTLSPAHAAVIDFEAFTGPSTFAATGGGDNPTIDGVEFEGGAFLDQTANLPANQTTVYGTASFAPAPGFANPITITFPDEITNFFLDVYNGLTVDITYRVSDNQGNSADFTLVPNLSNGQTTIGFAAAGDVITVEAITGLPTFDFFIDNIHFNEPLPPGLVPEPATLSVLGFGLLGLAAFRRRRTQ